MSTYESTHRFLRPLDLDRTRRNHRQLQVQRLLVIVANLLLASGLMLGGVWLWQRTMQDRRFAIRRIEVVGANHTAPADLRRVGSTYEGRNLFRLDIAQIREDFSSIPWVERIAIEKKLPDTLSIRIFERRPVALLSADGILRYVDTHGVVISALSPAVGNAELPLITEARREDLPAVIDLLQMLKIRDPALFNRVSEISPVDGGSFRLFDRALRTFVYVEKDGLGKYGTLYALATAEGYPPDSIQYADLRFRDRMVIRPRPGFETNNSKIQPAPETLPLSDAYRGSTD